jgi:hypothetical protein
VVPEGYTKIAFIRNPVSRIESVWRDKIRNENTKNKWYSSLRGMSPDEFWREAKKDVHKDAHIMPQDLLAWMWDDVVTVQTESMTSFLEEMKWFSYIPRANQTEIKTDDPVLSPASVEEIHETYRKDLERWEQAWSDGRNI